MKHPDDRLRRGFLKASSALGLAVAFGPKSIGELFADSLWSSPRRRPLLRWQRADPSNCRSPLCPPCAHSCALTASRNALP
jgi:anaerobic selenocysteine-containing dehydrogenase